MSAETLAYDSRSIDHLIQEVATPSRSRGAPAQKNIGRQTVARLGNRRRVLRSTAPSDVVVQVNGENVSVVDFSIRGLQIRSTGRLAPGATVMMTIRWRDESRTTLALTRVLWSTFEKPHRFASPQYRVGALYESADVQMIRAILTHCGLGTGLPEIEIVQSRW